MTGEETLLARVGLGVAALCVGLWAARPGAFARDTREEFNRKATILLAVSRLALFAVVFGLLKLPLRGDVLVYYFPQAHSALAGKLPYRDFQSSYAPLHPYLDALIILLWRSPLAIILTAVLAEVGAFWIWLNVARAVVDEQRMRVAAMLYLCSPISLQYVAIDGQNNILIALLLGGALLLLAKRRAVTSGALFALSAAVVKFLPLIFVPVYLLAAKARLRWVAGCAAVLAAGYGVFAAMRLNLLEPVWYESVQRGAGNLLFVTEMMVGRQLPDQLADGAVVLCALAVGLLVLRAVRGATQQRRVRAATLGVAAVTAALLVLSKKSWAGYMVIALFPLCLLVARERLSLARRVGWSVFCLAALTEHSVWASLLALGSSVQLHGALNSGSGSAALLLLLDIVAVVGYAWLLGEAVSELLEDPSQEPDDVAQPHELRATV